MTARWRPSAPEKASATASGYTSAEGGALREGARDSRRHAAESAPPKREAGNPPRRRNREHI
eukprot:4162618-Pyramimonas_sp.AAC.1